jgi:hypothetical protein
MPRRWGAGVWRPGVIKQISRADCDQSLRRHLVGRHADPGRILETATGRGKDTAGSVPARQYSEVVAVPKCGRLRPVLR